MDIRSILIVLGTIGLVTSVSSMAVAQSEIAKQQVSTSELNSEIVTEDDQRTRKPPRQATHNIGLKNGTDVICKKEKKKGTRLRVHKTCKTRAQWDVERLQAKQGLDEYKAQTSIGQSR